MSFYMSAWLPGSQLSTTLPYSYPYPYPYPNNNTNTNPIIDTRNFVHFLLLCLFGRLVLPPHPLDSETGNFWLKTNLLNNFVFTLHPIYHIVSNLFDNLEQAIRL